LGNHHSPLLFGNFGRDGVSRFKNTFPYEICAIILPMKQFGQKKRNFFGIAPWMEGPKTIFTAVAKPAS
jgi:hypothetical protein